MGFAYNGDSLDDGVSGYGLNPPAVGIDFLQGPLADPNDNIDNNRNGIFDEPGEQIFMSKFVYYNNDFSNIGNPSIAVHYYNYLRGRWKDNSPMVWGGTGYQTPGSDSCDFMFPGDSDPNAWGTHGVIPPYLWSEDEPLGPNSTPNSPEDRRFLMSCGAFTLLPGQVQTVTTSVMWARATSGGPWASVQLLKHADDQIQDFFNSCFTNIPTGISTSVKSIVLGFYPNPVSDQLLIRFQNNGHETATLRVYDPEGRSILSFSSQQDEQFQIQTSAMANGIYTFSIILKNGQKGTGKFAVLHP